MEIYKSYTNKGIVSPLYYLRKFNGKELEAIIYENGTIYPLTIRKKYLPDKAVKIFNIWEPVRTDTQINIGEGGIICLADDLLPAGEKLNYITTWIL